MIRHFWAHHRAVLLAFALALAALGFFGVRTLISAPHRIDAAQGDQPLAGWMTPRYVARAYGLPPDVLAPALFSGGTLPQRISLDTLIKRQGITLGTLQARVDAAAANWRANGGPAADD